VKTVKEILSNILFWLQDTQFKIYDLLFLLVYGAIIGFAIWHHEPWSDEALPWMIARDTDWGGFFNMMFHNYDRHPALLHTILIPFTKFGLPYFSQTILNLLLSLWVAFLFLTRAPFSRVFRVLFLFSYYIIYEYSVITRPYMLAVALVFTIALIYSKREKYPVIYAALITLLFHADYMGFGLASGLTLAFFLEYKSFFKSHPRMMAAFLMMALNGALVLWIGHALPPDHAEYGSKMAFSISYLGKSAANAFFPFAEHGLHDVLRVWMATLAAFAVLILTFVSLINKPIPALILGTSLGFLLTVFTFFSFGDYRNHGFILISVVFSLWIACNYPEDSVEPLSRWQIFQRKAARNALIITSICILFGLQNVYYVYVLERHLPFSGAKGMAKVIRQLEKEQRIFEQGFVIVAPHKNSVGIMPYLPGVKFWSPCTASYAAYYKSSRAMGACNNLSELDAVKMTKAYFGDLRRVLFLFRNPLPPFFQDPDYEFRAIFYVSKAFGYWYETFFLYQTLPKAVRKE